MEKIKNASVLKDFFLLHIAFFIYSMGGIFSKYASAENFLSFRYCCFYAGLLITLFVYAFMWQQTIKKINLTTAFANKGITVVWGLVTGRLIFGEEITFKKIAGAVIIITGIVIMVTDDGK